MKQPPPSTSKHSMTRRNPQPGCICKKASQAADESWQQTVQGHNDPSVMNPTVSEIDQSGSASQEDDDDSEVAFAPLRKSHLSAPQLQAQLSRLSDRNRLRRLKKHIAFQRCVQQVKRIEDLCHTHVSHKCLHHLDACVGSVLTPHDKITNVQKRLGSRPPRASVSAACSTAEATGGHCACVRAV